VRSRCAGGRDAGAALDNSRIPATFSPTSTTMSTPLTRSEIDDALRNLPGWKLTNAGDALEKTFITGDFSAALGFIVRVGIEAERMNHHPHLTNVWNRVTLRLNTHDAGHQVTARDVALAQAVEKLAPRG
jgi:4a-hydroxytetrahydrobiopterin dehydratase